jgi:hypothetical protein
MSTTKSATTTTRNAASKAAPKTAPKVVEMEAPVPEPTVVPMAEDHIFGSDEEGEDVEVAPAAAETKPKKKRIRAKKLTPEEKRLADLAEAFSEMEDLMARIRQLSLPLSEVDSESGSEEEPKAPRKVTVYPIPAFLCDYAKELGITVAPKKKRKTDPEPEPIDLDGDISIGDFLVLFHAFFAHNRERHEEARVYKTLPDGRREVDKEGNPVIDGRVVKPHGDLKKRVFTPIWKILQAEIARGEDSPHAEKLQKLLASGTITERGFAPQFDSNVFMSLVSFLIPHQEKKATKGKKAAAAAPAEEA